MSGPPTARFSAIFAPELHSRLLWFVRLRWLPAAGLAAASAFGWRQGFPSVWPSLLVVAAFVAAYNVMFLVLLRRLLRRPKSMENLRFWALAQMVMDLTALGVTVHFTGGMVSPLLPFFAFHMAIGTIMIKTRLMYVLAVFTSTTVAVLHWLELSGALALHPLDGRVDEPSGLAEINLIMLVVLLFGMVYLTDSVTQRFKERSIELNQRTEELRHRSRELERSLREKMELERRKSHYMRISAHQLRSPLGTIKTSLQVMLDGYVDAASSRGHRLLRGASERTEDLLAIVNDLLELAKMREGHTQAPWTRQVSVNQLLADIFDAMEPYASQREVRLTPDMRGAAILQWGVPPDLVFAFENLIQNAIKYSEPGDEVVVRLRVGPAMARVQVIDQGIGIPAESIDEIFLEFVRAPNAQRHSREGTGLGLSIVNEAITMHGGTVAVDSVVDQGTTFTVRLPLEHVPTELRISVDRPR